MNNEREDSNILRILQINASTKGYGGVSAILFNIYKNIDRTKVQFDFLSPNKTTYEIHREEIEKMGGHLYGLNANSNKIINKFLISKRLKQFLQQNKYNIVHINSGSYFFNLHIAMIAKKCKIKKIIVHSHNTLNKKSKIKNIIIKICKPLLNFYATDFFACSQKAAYDMFTKNVARNRAVIIKNGIEIEKFKFNLETREKIRNELNIENKLVIGNVGRFVEQKNQEFLIECFNEVHNINNNSVLLLIGEGELEKRLKEKVSNLKLEDCVKFLGLMKNVNELMQAIDVFVLPSIFEGFGIVGLEAQAAGVYTIVSKAVPEELKVTNIIEYLELDRGARYWGNKILEKDLAYNRTKCYDQVVESGYDIRDTAKLILKIYEN